MNCKKIIFSIFCGAVFLCFVTIGSIAAEVRTTRSTSGFYRADLGGGVAVDGTGQLFAKGYTRKLYADSNLTTFLNAMRNDDVVFVNTHGSTGIFSLTDGVIVTGEIINSSSLSASTRLLYISACGTGAYTTSSVNVCEILNRKGVSTVVAFEDDLIIDDETGGCDRFDSIFVYRWSIGNTVSQALSIAKSQVYSETDSYWGSDSYVIFGSGSLTMN